MRETVRDCDEFKRIWNLPIRRPRDLQSLAQDLTRAFRTPNGTMTLRPTQAQLILEAYDQGGAYAAMPVGSGKTLASFLLPAFFQCQRPLLIIPAKMKPQAQADLERYRQHFRLPDVRVMSYEYLSQPDNQEALLYLAPDLIILDEAHKFRNIGAARSRRFFGFLDRIQTRIVPMSGSVTRRRLKDFMHFLWYALPDGKAPVPYDPYTASMWGLALDSGVNAFERARPGPLLKLADRFGVPKDLTDLDRARQGFGARLASTPGVVIATEASTDAPLIIRSRPLTVPRSVDLALKTLRDTWVAPNGDELDSKLMLWASARELAQGFYSVWVPDAPEPWMRARKQWHKFVRKTIERCEPGLDSPFWVAKKYAEHPWHVDWVNVRDTFEPNPVAIWVDDFLLKDAAKWLHETRGIAWVDRVDVGERLAKMAGVRYYGAGKDNATAVLNASGPIVCSTRAQGEGRNMQRYNNNLLVSCPSSADDWNQIVGRTWRSGQTRTVLVDVYQHCQELVDSLLTAKADAEYIAGTLGQDQCLLKAQWST